MASNRQLLKQVRKVVATVNHATDNPEHKHILTAADVLLNELLLQDQPGFYVDLIAKGRTLLSEGQALAQRLGATVKVASLRDDIGLDTRMDALEHEILALYAAFTSVVEVLDEARSPVERDYLVRACDWENALYNHRLEPAASATADEEPLTRETLQAYLRKKFPERTNLKVVGFAQLSGGFSKKTVLFETEDDQNGHQAMVIRAEQTTNFLGYEGSDVTQEYHSIQLMRKAGVPTAEPLWLESDPSQLGTRFLVSRRAVGKTKGGNMGSEEPISDALLDALLATFAKMHGVRLDANDPLVAKSHFREWMPYKTVTEATRYCVTDFLPRLIRHNELPMTPQLLRALKWLERNLPQVDEPPVIVHVDFAFNNLIIDGDEVTAVLDWESSHLGDPAEDIIWTQYALAAQLPMPEFLKRYKALTGREVSAYRIAYARVLKCLLNAITCLSGLYALERDDDTLVIVGTLGLKYTALFGTQFSALIDDAEKVRGL